MKYTIPQQGWNQQTPAIQSMLAGGQRVVRAARKAKKAARAGVKKAATRAGKKMAGKAARFVKGSAAAKRHMAKLRAKRK